MKADQISVSVVLIGTFQPSRLTLDALKDGGGFLSAADAQSSQYVGLLPGQFVEIAIGGWGKISMVADSCTVEVSEAPFVRGVDLLLRIIRELAPTSVVKKMGINTKCWYSFIDPKMRDAVGVRLAPPENWGSWGRSVGKSLELPVSDKKHGGLIAAVMRQGTPDDREAGYLDVRIEAAVKQTSKGQLLGVQTLVNDHFECAEGGESGDTERVQTAKLLDALERVFDVSIDRAIGISDDVVYAGKTP